MKGRSERGGLFLCRISELGFRILLLGCYSTKSEIPIPKSDIKPNSSYLYTAMAARNRRRDIGR